MRCEFRFKKAHNKEVSITARLIPRELSATLYFKKREAGYSA